jgi:putative ABC transport system permease protein
MLRDLRYAFHLMVKERWYSAVAIVALALGIGVNATVFTLVNAILIRGLPYQDSARLYMLGSQNKDGIRWGVSALDFQDWRTQAKTFVGLAAFNNNGVNVSDDPRRRMRAAHPSRPMPFRSSPCIPSSAGTSRRTTSGAAPKA